MIQKHHSDDGNSKSGLPGIEPKALRLTEQHFPEFIQPPSRKDLQGSVQYAAPREMLKEKA
jgi:hypothetical protein